MVLSLVIAGWVMSILTGVSILKKAKQVHSSAPKLKNPPNFPAVLMNPPNVVV